MSNEMNLNEYLIKLRNDMGVTQKNVADYLGVDVSTYAHYESGRRTPNYEKLQRIAEYYNLDDELLGTGHDISTNYIEALMKNMNLSIEEAMDAILQADFLKQMAKGGGKKSDFEPIEVDSVEGQQEELIVETSCDEVPMTEDDAREKLDELDRKEFYNYDPCTYFKPDVWEITLHSAAIRFMASDSWLAKLFMSDEERLERALKNAKSLYDSLRTDARQRGEKSRSIRKQCKEERKRILDKFPEILNRKIY